MYETLFEMSPNGTPMPPLATDYRLEGLKLTVTLRKGVKFSNGEAFNADVAVANIERGVKIGIIEGLKTVAGVEKVDDFTIRINLKEPDPAILNSLSYTGGMMMAPVAMADFTLLFALTVGRTGDAGRPFLQDIQQGDNSNIWSAFLGGIIFNAANILLTAAIAIAGMSVAFPVGIGLALVIGVFINYLDVPVGNPVLLFSGVACIAVAIGLNAYAYKNQSGTKKASTKGLALSIISGSLMGLFYNYVAASMATDFVNPEVGKLTTLHVLVYLLPRHPRQQLYFQFVNHGLSVYRRAGGSCQLF